MGQISVEIYEPAGSVLSGNQQAFLIEALAEDRPDDLRRAYVTAMAVGPRWREHIANSLKRMDNTKSILHGIS